MGLVLRCRHRRGAGGGRPAGLPLVVRADGPGDLHRRHRRHARAGIRIKEVLPGFDGRKLDDITDFLTYTVLPLVLIWRAALLPAGTEWALVLPLLASAYGFCQARPRPTTATSSAFRRSGTL